MIKTVITIRMNKVFTIHPSHEQLEIVYVKSIARQKIVKALKH
jgi:hypothetical protein